jgi:hypothetical protein
VRLIAPGGGEVVTNVYTKRNNNGLYMMKMIQANRPLPCAHAAIISWRFATLRRMWLVTISLIAS